jgi:transposase
MLWVIDSYPRMIKHSFLSSAERSDLLRIAKNGLEEHRISRRANAILLLDGGMSFKQVAAVLFIDDSSIRAWRKAYDDGGVEAVYMFDLKGGVGLLSPEQMDALRSWAHETLPESTAVVGNFIQERFGLEYTRSGLIKLMHRIGFDWKKPETVPGKIDVQTQQRFIDKHEDLRNSIGLDEAIVYVDAVHPTHQSSPSGRWLPRGERCAVATASGRERLNLHGAIDLETGMTRIVEVLTVDAQSTISLFEALERAYPNMSKVHVFLDNARYHHAKLVGHWLKQPGRRIVLHFVPAYCPHLNPIERLWFVMHKFITHRHCFAKFRDFAEAMLMFLRETVPQNFEQFSSIITDNFRVIDPKRFRIVG